MNPKVLIIAGMHRSGTSLVTHWLRRCGLFVGQRLLPGNIGNVEGLFEDIDFLELHESFLRKRHCPDTGYVFKPFPALSVNEREQVKELIERKSRGNKEWGWKEPRTCLFLDIYHELIPSAFYLFVVRDYNATVNSLVSREYKFHMKRFEMKRGLSKLKWKLYKKKSIDQLFDKYAGKFLKTWIFYYERILEHVSILHPDRYLFLNYSNLLRDDGHVLDTLRNDWKFFLEYVPFEKVFKRELLSEVRDISYHIKDKSLIARAREIELLVSESVIKRRLETLSQA